jgi:two-component system sensor histidine kinase/response regulator
VTDNRKKRFYDFLLDHQSGLEMENVIFHGISVITLVYMFSMSAFNFFYEQYFLGGLLFGLCFFMILLYYYSRFRKGFKLSYLIFGLLCYPIIALNFYLNDGIAGPSAYVLLIFHVIMMVLSFRKHYFFWIIYNALTFAVLLYVDVFYPEYIPEVYLDVEHVYWDHLITYLVSIVGIFAIVSTIKKYYRLQKQENEAKSRELWEVNHMLQNSNEQKNKVIALISHDIRSPLNSIVSILEFVKAGELDDEELSLVRNELLTITSHTTKMLDNILEWASFEMQNKELNITENNIKSACENVLTVFAILAAHKDISLKTEYKDNPVVKTDLSRVILIVRNLVQNAIKFTPTGGKITFAVQQVGEEVQISVSDTGIGLSRGKLESLFLLDIHATYGTEREKGTGLGLYLSNENAKKIGAHISVHSEEGRGATFTLTLPQSIEH